MKRSNFLILLWLAVITTALFWEVDQSRAAPQDTPSQAITGKFRDPENVPKLRHTTKEQREEAARLAAEYREEVARTAHGNKKGQKDVSPTNENGGVK